MRKLDHRQLEDMFPTIYITLISVLLALCLEDLASQVRAAEHRSPFLWAVAAYAVGTTVSAWTGYSFIAITQRRRPRLLDSVNVFLLALGLFIINSTVTEQPFYFFFAIFGYMLAALYAVFYNVGMFKEALPFKTSFSDYQWLIYSFLPFALVAPVAGLLSYQGKLSDSQELGVALFINLQPISWALLFYSFWKRMLDRAKPVE